MVTFFDLNGDVFWFELLILEVWRLFPCCAFAGWQLRAVRPPVPTLRRRQRCLHGAWELPLPRAWAAQLQGQPLLWETFLQVCNPKLSPGLGTPKQGVLWCLSKFYSINHREEFKTSLCAALGTGGIKCHVWKGYNSPAFSLVCYSFHSGLWGLLVVLPGRKSLW